MNNKLFVYGIFLGKRMRDAYGMTDPEYATVSGYLTVGHDIVQAVKIDDKSIALTGLLVDVDPEEWRNIDRLEGGYDRIEIETNNGTKAWMYARPERKHEQT